MAMNPEIIAEPNWEDHCNDFFQKLSAIKVIKVRNYKVKKRNPRKLNFI